MNKHYRNQNGSIEVIAIVILVLALVGALGYIVWQKFYDEKAPATEQVVSPDKDIDNESTVLPTVKEYANGELSFEYPSTGWVIDETRYGVDDPLTPELKSNDYAQTGMGVDKGAIIFIVSDDIKTTLDQEFARLEADAPNFGGFDELKRETIGGKPAITYHSDYEGTRYHTLFVRDDKVYDVVYMFEYEGEAATHMATYDMVTESLIFKD